MKHQVHIHQQRLRQGLDAVIHRSEYLRTFTIPKGATVIQSDKPLSCGARAWIEWSDE